MIDEELRDRLEDIEDRLENLQKRDYTGGLTAFFVFTMWLCFFLEVCHFK